MFNNIFVYVLISAFLIMTASLSGVIFINKNLNNFLVKKLKYLVTLSAGVFIAITFSLIKEVLGHDEIRFVFIFSAFLLGILVVKFLSRLIPKSHHHHFTGSPHDHTHNKIDARRMLLGDALHNIVDGLLILPAFVVDFRLGVITAFGIFIHEFVQEISEFFVLKEAGYTTKQAIIRNMIVSSSILVGILISYFVNSIESLEPILLSFAAGGFVYIILEDLLPHSFNEAKKEKNGLTFHFVFILFGFILMSAINLVLPHAHGEEDHHEHKMHDEDDHYIEL